jgi:hypothetical protein
MFFMPVSLLRDQKQPARAATRDDTHRRALSRRDEGVGEGVVDDIHRPAVERGQRIARIGHELHLNVEALLPKIFPGLGVEQRRHADADQMADVDRIKLLCSRDKRCADCRHTRNGRRRLQEVPSFHGSLR